MKLHFAFLTLLVILISSRVGFAKVHVLKRGETLASVARSYYGEPVFGPRGTIFKIYQLNPAVKANPNLVEPGLELVLEDKVGETKKSAAKKVIPLNFDKKEEAPAPVFQPLEIKAPPVIETQKEEVPPQAEAPAAVAEKMEEIKKLEAPAPTPAPVLETEPAKVNAHSKAHFFIAPTYSQIQFTTTHDASGNNLNISSSSVFGAKLGWDQSWNESFSTLLTADYKQFKSNSTSSVTSATVVSSADLYRYDLALLNEIGLGSRVGFGLSSGQDLFVDTDATTLVPTTFTSSFIAPFLMADFLTGSWGDSSLRTLLKLSLQPAEAGAEHDVKKGTGLMLGLNYEQKIDASMGWSVGLSYETSDQARVGMKQKRDDYGFEIGFLF